MTSMPRLARALTVFHAWMEDSDYFDGNALYLDLGAAKVHAAYDYEGDEYGHPDEDDEGANIRPDFTWEEHCGRWLLVDHGKDTGVRVAERTVWRPATEREVEQQDALTAAEEAERAARPQVSMREALEALRP
ncbi:hypothetical protein JL475_00195 [Streptomyces sp. M2CJ-2]|uniref:hypothetical protein n=1 Tax=Streptomyces sp. M2CJ-2 TaxID=2803948 RepID=UPI001924BB3D|nr:hypothetical protein [Streptomyces sp. M2CJ-2]MBL3664465.1 hypothetical protein [Streptomyces sp. M2CJ-2]